MTDIEDAALARALAGAVLSDPVSSAQLRGMAAAVMGDDTGRGCNTQMVAGRIKAIDMPVFPLFASDAAAPATIQAWIAKATELGAGPEILESAKRKLLEFLVWAGPKKVPDLPAAPHATEAAQIVTSGTASVCLVPNPDAVPADAATPPAGAAAPARLAAATDSPCGHLYVRLSLELQQRADDTNSLAAETLCRVAICVATGMTIGTIENAAGETEARFWVDGA